MPNRKRDYLRSRAQAYQKTFKGVPAEEVLQDLAKFCRAGDSTFDTNPRIEGIMQGRREVWLRISRHLHMTEEQMWKYFNPQGE